MLEKIEKNNQFLNNQIFFAQVGFFSSHFLSMFKIIKIYEKRKKFWKNSFFCFKKSKKRILQNNLIFYVNDQKLKFFFDNFYP